MQILKAPGSWPSILLARDGTYDPDSAGAGLVAAEGAGAWSAWRRAITSLTPEDLIRIVAESGLRGRGGAGFPAGEKWGACRSVPSTVRYAVANGFEADPGAQVDRTLMESDPHSVLEGLALAAFAIDATSAYLVVNAGYGTAIRRLRGAIDAAEAGGYLGGDILGTGRELWIEVRELSGSFAVGEETILLRAVENKRAQPDQRPPWPAERGLWDKPTLINNVETLAAVPWILANGASAYADIGDPDNPGTTLVQLGGAVATPGIAEVPTGTPLRVLLESVAGGMSGGTLKALQVGGPSGGFLPPEALDTPLSHSQLVDAGAIMGSGTILAVDASSCIVDLATLMTRFLNDEACGKTIPCRIGTRRLAELREGFRTGRCRPSDPDLVRSLASDVHDSALCGLEDTAINPLLSGMRYFPQEFEDHILRSTCPAGVCHPIRVAAAAAIQ
jgi:NADH:ubiquinone oxidoreductase subunit F (NADH-binding)